MTNGESDLALTRLGLRFASPQTEAIYREWEWEDRLSSARLAGWVAVASWAGAAPLAWWFFPDRTNSLLILTYAIVVPWILVAILSSYYSSLPRFIRLVIPTLTLCMTGFASIELAMVATGSVLGISAALMINIFYAPFMRLTGGMATLALIPSVVWGIYLIVGEMGASNLDAFAAWFYCVLPIMSVLTVAVVNYSADRRSRLSYRDKCVIDSQKAVLEQTQGLIRRYLPPAVADHIAGGHSEDIETPQRRRVTMLFSDIVGFTDLADRLDAESLTQVLNEYMASMAEIVDAHDGTLNEFIGDGIMAVFGAPQKLEPETQALQAIASARAMHQKIPELHQRWRKLGLSESLQIRIGINTGVVSVGSFGSEGRMTYTAIGLQTNIAARIQSHCEPGGILISDATWQLINDVMDCESKGEVDCKGVHYPVKVYEPRSGVNLEVIQHND